MWARHFEIALGLWLAASVFILAVPNEELAIWIIDLCAAALIVGLSLACHWKPLRRAHLGVLVIALALILFAFVQPRPLPRWQQNHLLVGLMLAMFAVVPSRASEPPRPWREQLAASKLSPRDLDEWAGAGGEGSRRRSGESSPAPGRPG